MTVKRKLLASKQGELDGACGFYAITNALHLLEPELDKNEIFRLVLASFLEDGHPMRFVEGTNRGSIKKTLSRVIKRLHESYEFFESDGIPYRFEFSIPYWQRSTSSRKEVLETLTDTDYLRGKVAIIGYTKCDSQQTYSHWTVIKKSSNQELYTFDSSFEDRKIFVDSIRIDATRNRNSTRPFNIHSGDIFLISRDRLL